MKKLISIILLMLLVINLYSKSNNSTQILKAGHWIYDSLNMLSLENSKITNAVDAPLSVEALYFFNNVDIVRTNMYNVIINMEVYYGYYKYKYKKRIYKWFRF